MKIRLFNEDKSHRLIVDYDPNYARIFTQIKTFVESSISRVELFHIGSTAIPDLRSKPMIDIAAVTTHVNLRFEQKEFEELGFHRRDVWVDTDTKPYVCGSIGFEGRVYNINIHICHLNDWIHKESLLFIKTLNARPDLRRKYEQAKDYAHSVDPLNPEKYNKAKEAVINEIFEVAKRL